MKQIREILQTYLVIVFTTVQVFLVSRFCIDFFGTQSENSLLALVRNVSSFLLRPFELTFTPSSMDGSTLDYSTLYAIAMYALVGILTFRISKIITKTELHKKSLELVNTLFTGLETLMIIRIVSDICKAGPSFFYTFVFKFTNVFITPLSFLTDITGDLSGQLAAVLSMIVIGIIWFTFYKVIEGLSSTAQKIAEQPVTVQTPEVSDEPLPITTPTQTIENNVQQEQVEQYIQDPVQNSSMVPNTQQQPAAAESKTSPVEPIKNAFSSLFKADKEKPVFEQPKNKGGDSRESPLA